MLCSVTDVAVGVVVDKCDCDWSVTFNCIEFWPEDLCTFLL